MAYVRVAEPLGEQHLDPAAAQLAASVAEEFVCLAIGQHDSARRVDHHDPIGCGLQQVEEFRFDKLRIARNFQMRDVLLAREDVLDSTFGAANRLGGDGDVDELSVFLAT
jgi:hypothetical protein